MVNKILGVDFSINHAGFVLIDEKMEISRTDFVTDRRKLAQRKNGIVLSALRIKDMHQRSVARLAFWDHYIRLLLKATKPTHMVIEDYAYRAIQFAHQIGEVGGLFRLQAWNSGVRLRFVEPNTVKMFVAHNGSASNINMETMQRWPQTRFFEEYREGQDIRTTEDLCDAFGLAVLGLTEIKLREGTLKLSSLHPKEIQVFNRTTRQFPVNILGREWIQKEASEELSDRSRREENYDRR
jgi:Holliday junction resolvasome RuvABC endonuclease subunit